MHGGLSAHEIARTKFEQINKQLCGYALRMRWLWLRRTDPSRPWLHLTDDREPIVEAMFQNSTYIELGDGNTALFWSDRWLHGTSLEDMAPCLCNAVSARVRAQCTVAQALTNKQWIKDISGALTVQVLVNICTFGIKWSSST